MLASCMLASFPARKEIAINKSTFIVLNPSYRCLIYSDSYKRIVDWNVPHLSIITFIICCRKKDIPSIVEQTRDKIGKMCDQLYFEENGIKDEVTEVSFSR